MNSRTRRRADHLDRLFVLVLAGLLPLHAGGRSASAAGAAGAERGLTFTTEGASFAPVLVVQGRPDILWTWSDGTTSTSATPHKGFGAAGTRQHVLRVKPWIAIRRINLGYDAGDGGSGQIEKVPDQQVSAVTGLTLVAPTLEQWCSSYNRLTSLDFSNFVNLDTIECFLSPTLVRVNLANTPKLKRACFEDCDLESLDLSQSPALEDLRGAQNRYPTIEFGRTGRQVWHICVRDNPQMTDQAVFADLTQFPNLSEFFVWNDNQAGALRLPASSPDRGVALLADGNHYTSLDLSGSLRNAAATGTVSFRGNQLSRINIAGCVQITELSLENNRLDTAQVDGLLTTLDRLGRNRADSGPHVPLKVDLRGNAPPGPVGQAAAGRLAAKGWTIVAEQLTRQPPPPPDTGKLRIDFITRGDGTNLRCDLAGSATGTWYWSDGTSSPAVSGASTAKSGLGAGEHAGYLLVSNGSALTRFGAADGGGQGHLIAIGGLDKAPLLEVLYAYNEDGLAKLSRTAATKIREYHLWGTALTPAAIDRVFADAAASGVRRGRMWSPNRGTPASDKARAVLAERQWEISY
ncbi:MAG TPA: hypothetical protein PLF81_10010 [Candidatus Anammoximicrobium sp.]|nr:hypothetical protein [Candidatus Anammoximicrobium sp.]